MPGRAACTVAVARIAIEREARQRVVDHGGDALAEVRQRLLQHGVDLGAIGDVGRQRDRLSAQFGSQGPCGGLAAVVVHDDARTLRGEGAGNVRAKAAAGAGDGLKLALNIGAMLLAFIALIALLNAPLTWLGDVTGLAAAIGKPTNLSTIFGYVLAPIAWVIGTPS
ncbi:hypothetical protein G6F40_014427 [Rhizopus arrhizus]|nr:hypothetical protein G6F40_014427 [Rhizopus arrhizus]